MEYPERKRNGDHGWKRILARQLENGGIWSREREVGEGSFNDEITLYNSLIGKAVL